MPDSNPQTRRLTAIFLLAAVLFNYPILSLVNVNRLVAGIPLLYLCLFGSWGLIVLLMALATRSRTPPLSRPKRGR